MLMTTVEDNKNGESLAIVHGPGSRLRAVAVVLAPLVFLLCGATRVCCEEPSAAAGISLSIAPTARVVLETAVEPSDHRVFSESDESGEVPLTADVVRIDVVSNTTRWGVAVRLTEQITGKQGLRTAVAICRLVSEGGEIIREMPIQDEEVFMDGNGARGLHTLFVEVWGLPGHSERTVLSEPVVDVRGWAAAGGE